MSYDDISAPLMNKFCGFSLWEIYVDDLELFAILSRKKYLYFLCIIRNRPVLNLECERTVQGACLLSLSRSLDIQCKKTSDLFIFYILLYALYFIDTKVVSSLKWTEKKILKLKQ